MIEANCEKCKHYAKLEHPFQYAKSGYPDGVTVYGFCGKNATKSFSFYPVYIPDGGACKEFKQRGGLRSDHMELQNQLVMEGA